MKNNEKKSPRKWTGKIVMKYLLLQIPSTILLILIVIIVNKTVRLPLWLSWGIIIASILKDIVLFPFVWRSYDSGSTHAITGSHGIVAEPLSPEGYVRIHDQLWQAKLTKGYGFLEKGKAVLVKDVRGIKLIVEPTHREKDV